MTGLADLAIRAILLIPLGAALLLAMLPGYRLTARLNVLATMLTFTAALVLLLGGRPMPGAYLLVDDLNIVFIVLGTLVGFTTSIFSASYIQHELDTGKLTPGYLRFYHAMYQALMFGMNLALVANNIGLMWVAIELATLTTEHALAGLEAVGGWSRIPTWVSLLWLFSSLTNRESRTANRYLR